MFDHLRFAVLYRAYLRNEHGIKKFAEMSMGQLIRRVTKKSAAYREMIETLQVEKANLRIRRDELYERPTLDGGRFFSSRQQYWTNNVLMVLIIMASTFLNELAIRTLLQPTTLLSAIFAWLVAILVAVVLTGGGMVMASRLIAALMLPVTAAAASKQQGRRLRAMMWGSLLFIIECTIVGLAEVQAAALAEQDGNLLYLSYILGALALPLIGGALRWHNMRFIDPYKTTLVLRRVESRLAQIDSTLRQSEEYESNFYKIKSIEYWDQVNAFKTLKDNRNRKEGIVEQIGGHFAQSYAQFQTEANKRYVQDIRDLTSQSMRKLKLVNEGTTVGRKIGQDDDPSPGTPPTGTPAADYLGLKPVR